MISSNFHSLSSYPFLRFSLFLVFTRALLPSISFYTHNSSTIEMTTSLKLERRSCDVWGVKEWIRKKRKECKKSFGHQMVQLFGFLEVATISHIESSEWWCVMCVDGQHRNKEQVEHKQRAPSEVKSILNGKRVRVWSEWDDIYLFWYGKTSTSSTTQHRKFIGVTHVRIISMKDEDEFWVRWVCERDRWNAKWVLMHFGRKFFLFFSKKIFHVHFHFGSLCFCYHEIEAESSLEWSTTRKRSRFCSALWTDDDDCLYLELTSLLLLLFHPFTVECEDFSGESIFTKYQKLDQNQNFLKVKVEK